MMPSLAVSYQETHVLMNYQWIGVSLMSQGRDGSGAYMHTQRAHQQHNSWMRYFQHFLLHLMKPVNRVRTEFGHLGRGSPKPWLQGVNVEREVEWMGGAVGILNFRNKFCCNCPLHRHKLIFTFWGACPCYVATVFLQVQVGCKVSSDTKLYSLVWEKKEMALTFKTTHPMTLGIIQKNAGLTKVELPLTRYANFELFLPTSVFFLGDTPIEWINGWQSLQILSQSLVLHLHFIACIAQKKNAALNNPRPGWTDPLIALW
jgi:hypothetical protein